jgi:hypothetical protein
VSKTQRHNRDRARVAGVALLDVLTGIVLVVAVYLLIRPGSELHRAVARWRDERALVATLRSRWDEAIALAQPLYDTGEKPEVLEFLDYECPFCRTASTAVDSAVAAGVKIAVVQLPLEIHPLAKPAALAALCASASGDFLEVHRMLIESTSWRDSVAATGRVGLGVSRVATRVDDCIATGRADGILRLHVELAQALRVSATPRFVSHHRALGTPPTVASLLELRGNK